MRQIRQGDVLLVPFKRIPNDAKPVARDKGKVVLAYGETTGHAHAFTSPHVTLLQQGPANRERRYLRVESPAVLAHIGGVRPDHDPSPVPAGTYRVVQQREFRSDAEPRPASD